MFRFLFQLQSSVYATHGFAVQAEVLHWLLSDVASAVLSVWESAIRGRHAGDGADHWANEKDGTVDLHMGNGVHSSSSSASSSLLSSLPFSALLQVEFRPPLPLQPPPPSRVRS